MADIVLQGFHGTSEINGKSIADMQQFRPSTNDDEYLGPGVYFFIGGFSDPEKDAEKWAKMRFKDETKTVLTADIQTDTDRIFDLSKSEALKAFNFAKNHTKRINLPNNRRRHWWRLVDTYVISNICAKNPDAIDVVKKPYFVNFKNGELPSGIPNVTIACVVNNDVIGNIQTCRVF